MLKSSLPSRIYFFACNFMWCNLSLLHYLNEELEKEAINIRWFNRWRSSFNGLVGWLGNARHFPLQKEQLEIDEKGLLYSTADKLGDLLIFYMGGALNDMATAMHQNRTELNKSIWLYYCYCSFLWQTLKEFDQVLQGPSSSRMYYQHYQEHIKLFNDMKDALEREREILDFKELKKTDRSAVWDRVDANSEKLGAEWRQAVLSAAHNLELPDFDDKAS